MAILSMVMQMKQGADAAGSSVLQGLDAKNAASYNARVLGIQADLARQDAERNAELREDQTRRVIGASRVRAAASGVEANAGSPLSAALESLNVGILDTNEIYRRGDRAAWGYETERALQLKMGQRALYTGLLNAYTSLQGGAANAFGTGVRSGVISLRDPYAR